MKRVDKLIPNIASDQQIQAGSKQAPSAGAKAGRDHVDAINQVFAELELAYHNQFHKAYAQDGALGLAKKYWLGVLQEYTPQVILMAVRQVVRKSEFLPSLAAIVRACENAHSLFGLPDARAAYIEACCAAEPKASQSWSHPAVYLAAEATGWFALSGEVEAKIFPLFEYNYQQFCHRVVTGESLEIVLNKALPKEVVSPLSPEENLKRLGKLRKQFDL